MYFWTMHVFFLLLVDSSISDLISSKSFETEMPLPRFVFSPGLMIQVLSLFDS